MKRWRGLGIVVAIGVVLPAAVTLHAQQRRLPGTTPAQLICGFNHAYDANRLDTWLKAIDAHRPGVIDEPAKTIAPMEDKALWCVIMDLEQLLALTHDLRARTLNTVNPAGSYGGVELTLEDLDRILGVGDPSHADNRVNQILKRGTILHTDLAFLAPRRPSRGGSGSRDNPSVAIVGQDGSFESTSEILVHVIIGRYLLDAVTPDPAEDESVRAWYYATTSILEGHQMFADTRPHIQKALQLMPGDPIVLFYAGAFHEMLAGPSVQGVATEAASRGYNVNVLSSKTELQNARAFYTTALKMGSTDPELYLHLGRVKGQLGEHEEAIEALTRASDGVTERALQYHAAMFLAAEYEALERWDEARVSLLRASALFPKAQSALVALSRLSHRRGDAAGAIAPLDLLFGLRGTDPLRDDPWWNYPVSHARNSVALLARARQRLAGGGS